MSSVRIAKHSPSLAPDVSANRFIPKAILAMSSELMDERSQKRPFRLTTALVWDCLEWSLYVSPHPLDIWSDLDYLFAITQDKGVFHVTVFDAHKLVETVEADSYSERFRRYPFRLIPDCMVDDYYINNETQEGVDARSFEYSRTSRFTSAFPLSDVIAV